MASNYIFQRQVIRDNFLGAGFFWPDLETGYRTCISGFTRSQSKTGQEITRTIILEKIGFFNIF
jgi:hypothetical protein